MSLTDKGIFVRFVSLPFGVKGVTLPNDDCTFDVYINSNLDETIQQDTLKHELEHIFLDHLYIKYESVTIEELTANKVI